MSKDLNPVNINVHDLPGNRIAVKRLGSSAGVIPARKLVAPSGSYRSGGGGNEAVEAFETTGRFGGSASRQAATKVNAVQAPKQPDVEADPVAIRGRPPSWRQEGITPHDATSSRVPPGYWRWHVCTRRPDATREASAVGARDSQPTTREGQVGPFEVAERPV